MLKSKKKTKSVKLPKPINIKKEKTEEDRTPHPISHYIDDRLELVKQIFGTLKPKTITNLAPDFLKKKSMDEIEELCLNELICISTKRLLSIINATKCPTDTESSGDSDVHHEEEHISLEEISSDSEIEGTSSNAAKKKSTGSKAKKDAKESAKKEENNGQISVLELLELQARARAIRSQLALEPVTKIEVDSDEGDNKEGSKSAKDRKEVLADRKRKSTEKDRETTGKPSTSGTKSTAKQIKTNGSTEAKSAINTAASTVVKETEKRREKRIKLKRNYRNNNEQAAENTTKLQEKSTPSVEPSAKEVKKERSSRSASPDVIPIVAEPETLFISDSSDAEEKEEKEIAKAVEKTVKPKENILAEGQADTDTVGVSNEAKSKVAESTVETEEGEITDTETDNGKETAEIKKSDTSLATERTDGTKNVVKKSFEKGDASKEMIIGVPKSVNSDTESGTVEELKVTNDPELVVTVSNVDATRADKEEPDKKRVTNFQDDDDQNDDIISIEGGDLESEMIEHLEDSSSKNSFATTSKEVDEHTEQEIETISLNSSEDDGESKAKPSESWHSRYLNSSKVSKVLAASRLSKRVRDKIRKSNSSKKDKIRETEEAEVPKSSKEAFISQHEDGSVEQYRELLELRQRKT